MQKRDFYFYFYLITNTLDVIFIGSSLSNWYNLVQRGAWYLGPKHTKTHITYLMIKDEFTATTN